MDTPVPAPPLEAEDELQVLARMPPPSPEILARTDAWLAALTPEERALLELANRADQVDYKRDR